MRTPLFLAAVLVATSPAFAAGFAFSPKDINLQGAKYIKQSKRIMLPAIYLEVMNWGKIRAVTQTSALQTLGGASNSTVSASMEVAVPLSLALLDEVAAELATDLTEKLRGNGWEVITFDEVKASPIIAGVSRIEPDAKLGAPVRKVTIGKQKTNYTIATPGDMPVLSGGLTGPLFAIRNLMKEKEASALQVTYRFDPVALQAKSRHGIGNNTASTAAEAKLVLAAGDCTFATPKGFPGSVGTKRPVAVEGGVGEIKKAADVSPAFANALSDALNRLSGFGAISSTKGLYVCELDEAKLKAGLLEAGKAFNDEILKAFGKPE